MKVLIIEDELPAAEKIERYIKKYDDSFEILNILGTVEASVSWLEENKDNVDLIISDIQLTDGLSFGVFQQVQVNIPVIFTTAYDEYAIDAFKLNSIDYLLKPVTFMDLSNALNKLNELQRSFKTTSETVNKITKDINKRKFKNRFMVKLGEHIHSVVADDIAMFFADGRTAYLVTMENRKFVVDYKLEQLEELLNPAEFFRPNRTFIIHINAIKDVLVYSNSRLKVTPTIAFDKEIIVSRERVGQFKEWFGGA